MKKITSLLFIMGFCWRFYAQTNIIPKEVQHIIQHEIDDWKDLNSIFDTCHVYISQTTDSAGSLRILIKEFGKDGYIIDSSTVIDLQNGKKKLLTPPEPIFYSDPFKINYSSIFRWKYLYVFKDDMSCYYLWNNSMDPRGVKKLITTSNNGYYIEKGRYYYFDTEEKLCGKDSNIEHTKDTIQRINVGIYNVTVIGIEDGYRIIFCNGKDSQGWDISGETVHVTKTSRNSFSILVSTYWPNYMVLEFGIDSEGQLKYYVTDIFCEFSMDSNKWGYVEFKYTECNIVPWIVKKVYGEGMIMASKQINQ